ncbi:translational activator of GCN4 [Chytriomyces hyalinus]|nr:translational activator of GCN4 [Chytriomyces hyalinus]
MSDSDSDSNYDALETVDVDAPVKAIDETQSLPWNEFAVGVSEGWVSMASLVARVRVDSAVDADTESLARVLATLVKCIGDSRHAAALEALKLLLRNKTVNQNGIVLKGAARLLERAWAGYGSDSIILFNCLKWSSLLLQTTVPRQHNIERSKKKTGETPQIDLAVFTPLLATHAAIIDALVRSFSLHPHIDGRKNRLILQSVKLARKFMLIGKHGFMPNLVLSTILNNEKLVDGTDSTAIRYALVLGEAVGCLVYKKWDLAHVTTLKDKIAKYFEKNLIAGSAKSAVSKTVLSSFDLFFKQFLTAEMLQNQLCASAERLMLRSPEFILRIFESIIKPIAFDISQLFRVKFVDSLLNNMKSTNEAIRADAASLFKTFASKSSNADELLKVADVVLKAFTARSPSPETRALYFSILASFPAVTPAISGKIIATLIPLTAKETSEPALLACFAALAAHTEAYLATSDSSILTQLVTFITSGLTDAKSSNLIRKSILGLLNKTSFEALSTRLAENSLLGVCEACIKCLDKVQAGGTALLVDTGAKKENPVLVEGYLAFQFVVGFSVWEEKSGKAVGVAKLVESKKTISTYLSTSKTFFLNEKFYAKLLTSKDDQLAFFHCLSLILTTECLYAQLPSTSRQEKSLFASAWAHLMMTPSVNHEVRRSAIDYIQNLVCTSSPEQEEILRRVANIGRMGIGAIVEKSVVLDRPNPSSLTSNAESSGAISIAAAAEASAWGDDVAKQESELSARLFATIQSLIPSSLHAPASLLKGEKLQLVLMELLVLCAHPVVTSSVGKDAWIRVCWRCGVDPLNVVASLGGAVVERWMASSLQSATVTPTDAIEEDYTLGGFSVNVSAGFQEATLNAITLLVGVFPEVVLNKAMPSILESLDNAVVKNVTLVDIAIWKGEEGVAVCDSQGKLKVAPVVEEDDERPKTAEEKWERELKKELQAKKGASAASTAKAPPKSAGKPVSAKAAAAAKAEKEAEKLQLEKESANRKRVEAIRLRVLGALQVLESILNGVVVSLDEDARETFEMWMSRSIEAVLRVVERESVIVRRGKRGKKGPLLVGKKAIDVFRLISKATGDRIWRVVEMGWDVATLRLMGVEISPVGISEDLCKKDLSVVLTKLLTAAKADYVASNPLSPGAFSYIFPLIYYLLLRIGRTRNIKEKIRTELIIFASEILISHCGLGGSPLVPRRSMVHVLIELLNTLPRLHGAAREGLLTLCVSMEDSAADEEDEDPETLDESEKLLKKMLAADEVDISNELLDALLSSEPMSRQSALRALQHMPMPAGAADGVAAARVWAAKYDADEEIAAEAGRVWEMWNGESSLDANGIQGVVDLICDPCGEIRAAAGKSLSAALSSLNDHTIPVLKQLFALYEVKNAVPMPEYDDFGIVIPESLDKKDEWPARSGIALALQSSASVMKSENILNILFDFLIKKEALGDREESVRLEMLEAGIAAVNTDTGKTLVNPLLKTFSEYLAQPAGSSKTHDLIRESAVILLGTVAQHLDASDKKIPEVVDRLVETLKTPSEVVQMAVSECLPPLVKVMSGDEVRGLIDRLLRLLFTSPKYAERRGAAYGIAGTVKGRGISSLKEYGVMSSLKDAVEDKKKMEKREGALFAFEALSMTLGRLFEPYVIQILPLLLVCYGDSQREVREATNDACKAIMSKLSGHCVKLVMPSLLNGLDDKTWRTKTGSIEVLGSMAALAPKQLSLSLPTIIPRLCEVLTDTHIKVQESAKQALNAFGSVIKNPEIQELVPELLAALVDPNENTQPALTALLETSFVHYIDSPSLALIVPILQRGLIERVTETKKRAAQIMGQMATLTDQKDLIPYLPILLPGLKEVLVDPVPEARAIASHALGSMFAKLGEGNFPGLVGELFVTLKSETSAVDRSGAAQGLSEVLAGAGIPRLESLLPDILNNAMSPRTYVREGFITLLVFLPATFGDSFQPYIGSIIPPILRGLADETDTVRETAMKAGRGVVRNYATTAVDLLLPELELGLFDENWRIRQSSVQLMGELLYRIAGVSGKADVDGNEDESVGTEHNKKALVTTLGQDRYDSVLSSLYIVRSDSNGIVRSAALHVWKSIVNNTPRTLKEILPVIIQMVIESLASPEYEKRGVAARTLGDLVRKLGDLVLDELVPVLEAGLESDDATTREGACIGMSEIMSTAGKAQLVDFVAQCVPSIKKALMDSEPEVREAAAQAFDMLHQHMGSKAIDEVLPSLLNELKSGGSASGAYALEALKEIMSVRSNVVFPVLIPTLLTTPITAFNARALASLISVAGSALNKRLATILPALMDGLEQNDHAVVDIRDALKVLMLSVDEDGLYLLMPILSESISEGGPSRARAACDCFMIFCEGSKVDISEYAVEWFNKLIEMFRGAPKYSAEMVKAAWGAVDALSKRIKKDDMERFVTPLRRAIAGATEKLAPNAELEGFCLPKGISSILPVFLQGLMYGQSDVREESAKGLGDLVQRTSADGLKAFVTQITGPLIRIIGDRMSPGVKAAILKTLGLLLVKVPANLKPFLPQLQRTFIKSLSEPSIYVQTPARKCLTLLISLQPRLDPLVVELTTGIKTAEDKSVRDSMWGALLGLLNGLEGKEITDVSKKTIETLLVDSLFNTGENDDVVRKYASKCFAVYANYLSKDDAKSLISTKLLSKQVLDELPAAFTKRHGLMEAISRVLVKCPEVIVGFAPFASTAVSKVFEGFQSEKSAVLEATVSCANSLLVLSAKGVFELAEEDKVRLLTGLIEISKEGVQVDARRMSVLGIKTLAKKHYEFVAAHLSILVPTLMLLVRERVIPIKLAAERSLLHLLCLSSQRNDPSVLTKYASGLDNAAARNLSDYAKRVLTKLADKESDDEGGDEDDGADEA